MKNEAVMRDEPGGYRVIAEYFGDGAFSVKGESVKPLTLTVRVEDAWNRMPAAMRRFSYTASVWRDGEMEPGNVLSEVAPDARIFLDFQRTFRIDFS